MTLSAARVDVGTTPTRLSNDTYPASTCTVRNPKANTGSVYVGDGTVTTSTGFEVAPGDTISIDATGLQPLYGVAASTQNVHVLSVRQ